jgi:hypothetical protein
MKTNKTFTPNRDLYKWEFKKDLHGNKYRIDFIGRHPDEGQETTTTVSISGVVSFKIKVGPIEQIVKRTIGGSRSIKTKANDQSLGGEIIDYCDPADPPGTTYNNGILRFNVIEIVNCN